ncbi:MAG TPA: prolipoprotein diacylglyceryl transferase, partial [Steroidobacteraceae bacterium]
FERFVVEPWMIVRVWEGGMSFHGGLLGVLLAESILARKRGHRIADMFDFIAPLPGLGILAVRIANFINGELWGKPTTVPWGFIVDPEKLHPTQRYEALSLCERFDISPCVLQLHASQLYEGFLEGLVLFVILWTFTSKPRPRLAPSGLFLVCYGVARFAVEFVRIPDENRGYLLFDWVTMGQILSLPMIVAGIALLIMAYRRNEPSGNVVEAAR